MHFFYQKTVSWVIRAQKVNKPSVISLKPVKVISLKVIGRTEGQ